MEQTKFILEERDMPKQWYNVLPDLPKPLDPLLSPQTKKPPSLEELTVLFPVALLQQEMATDRYIDIPEEVLEILRLYRPSPLFRARRLEKALGTPAKLYYKYEGGSPAGSHKVNTAVAQAYYNKKEGIKRLSTETGAGQWGSALSMACKMFDLECQVYMVKASYEQKPYRHMMMETYGASVTPSPSTTTNVGRAMLAEQPDHPGSLGMAISEAVEDAATREDTHYALGSVLNHVLLHQTVIGMETQKQFEMAGDKPDVIYGCIGGGSSFGGMVLPYIPQKAAGDDIRLVAVEPASCPTLTKGVFAYDYGDVAKIGPIAKMYTLGHDFVPAPIHAGGLRYHGDSPIISLLYDEGIVEAKAYKQLEIFDAALEFARSESIIPAPESSHAIKAAIDEALECKENGEERTICFLVTGHGYFDMTAYDDYLNGRLEDDEFSGLAEEEALKKLPVCEVE